MNSNDPGSEARPGPGRRSPSGAAPAPAEAGGRVRREYAGTAAAYEARWQRYLDESIAASLASLTLPPGGRLLDVGCGTGLLLERATALDPGMRAVGLDLTPEMLERAAHRGAGRWRLVLGDAQRLPFASTAFDAVVSTSALHHWPEPRLALHEIARVLRPGGQLVITDWCRDDPLFRPFALYLRLTRPAVHHVHSLASARRLLEAAGFRSIHTARFRIPPLWGMMTVSGVLP